MPADQPYAIALFLEYRARAQALGFDVLCDHDTRSMLVVHPKLETDERFDDVLRLQCFIEGIEFAYHAFAHGLPIRRSKRKAKANEE